MDTTPQPLNTLADRLTHAIQVRGMSRRELSRKAGYSEATVGHLTRGHITNPKHETIAAVAGVLHVSYRWLVMGVGTMDDVADIPPEPPPPPPRTYGQLEGWKEAEQEAMNAVPNKDWAILGVRRAEVDEEPKGPLTGDWVAYRIKRFIRETEDNPELRMKLDHDVRHSKRRATPAQPASQSRINRRDHRG